MFSIQNPAAEAVGMQRSRAEALCRSAAAEFEAVTRLMEQAHRTCAELHALLALPAYLPAAPRLTAAQFLAASGLTDDDLADLADDLIVAYRKAEASGDTARRATFARALATLGRHLATGLGPRAAGFVLH